MEIRMQKGAAVPPLAAQKTTGHPLLFYILALLLSRSALFGEIMPFGVALYAARYISSPPYLLGVIAILSAFLPLGLPATMLKYALSVLLFSVLASKKGPVFLKTPARRGAVMGASVFVSGLFLLLGGQILVYDCFILVLEMSLVFIFTCLFALAGQAFGTGRRLSAPLDILSVSALFGVATIGLSSFFRLYGLYVTLPFSVLSVLLLTHESGITAGAISGITLGVFATLESGNPVLGAFAASGMAAGYFSKYGRGGAVLAFIFAHTAVSFYVGGTAESVLRFYEIAAPSVIYLALPRSLLGQLSFDSDNMRTKDVRVASLLSDDLKEKAEAFTFLSETFTEISENRYRNTNMAAATFFEKGARRICQGCSRLSLCWNKEFHRTYAAFFVMFEICKKNGTLTKTDIPVSLEEKCPRRDILPEMLSTQYEIYKVDKLWETRMQECRQLLSRQLSAVSHILFTMEKNVRHGSMENCALAAIISSRLSEAGIPIQSISVTEKRRGAPFISLSASPDLSAENLLPILSETVGMPLEVISGRGGRFCFAPVRRISLHIYGESVAKNDSPKSGDSFENLHLENGQHLLLLSDGMGSGEKAAMESRSAVKMLSALFSAGFDADTAIGLVNSLLVLKSSEDSFATLDLFSVHTDTLKAEFIKVGAAPSFIKRGNTVHTFSSKTLPVGILPSPDTAKLTASVKPGDMIVMLSDGVCDSKLRGHDETWIREGIEAYTGDDPRDLCRILLESARKMCDGHIGDDMTVLCATVCQNTDLIA